MNQRRLPENEPILPQATIVTEPEVQTVSAEEVAFDKAEKAEEIENQKDAIKKEIEELEEALKDLTDESMIAGKKAMIEQKRDEIAALEEAVDPAR